MLLITELALRFKVLFKKDGARVTKSNSVGFIIGDIFSNKFVRRKKRSRERKDVKSKSIVQQLRLTDTSC